MFSGSTIFSSFFSDCFILTFAEILFSQQFLNCQILEKDIFAEDVGYIT